jgi:hypothetical protein
MSEPQRWVIDAIEEQTASVELPDGKLVQLSTSLLPKGAKAGQVLQVTFEIDTAATRQATAESAAQAKKGSEASKKRDPGGDITL